MRRKIILFILFNLISYPIFADEIDQIVKQEDHPQSLSSNLPQKLSPKASSYEEAFQVLNLSDQEKTLIKNMRVILF